MATTAPSEASEVKADGDASGGDFLPVRAIEFFCGVGGLHYSLKQSGIDFMLVCALDVDENALRTYKHNHKNVVTSGADISAMSEMQLSALHADAWLLSPPCQPFSRVGEMLGEADARTGALSHLISLLESCALQLLPRFMLLENVAGFESSSVRRRLTAVLRARGFDIRELWASPAHFGVPNQRTRYFLLARQLSSFCEASSRLRPLLLDSAALDALTDDARLPLPHGEPDASVQAGCAPLSAYLLDAQRDAATLGALRVPAHVLERYAPALDLVTRHSRRSCCFTKNYTRYLKGTGSVILEGAGFEEPLPSAKTAQTLEKLQPRFFGIREIARLHGFPESFDFPESVTRKKQYELLGNSLSVQASFQLFRFSFAFYVTR
uniref:DNA (cytosine-5-)-methyltransferase n=1 Tax=Chrysotila carterae TaxID=13221 RepID=A0A7S4B0L0_CHRCT